MLGWVHGQRLEIMRRPELKEGLLNAQAASETPYFRRRNAKSRPRDFLSLSEIVDERYENRTLYHYLFNKVSDLEKRWKEPPFLWMDQAGIQTLGERQPSFIDNTCGQFSMMTMTKRQSVAGVEAFPLSMKGERQEKGTRDKMALFPWRGVEIGVRK